MVESANFHIPALLTNILKPVKKLPRPQPTPTPPQPDFIEDSLNLSSQSLPDLSKSGSTQSTSQKSSTD